MEFHDVFKDDWTRLDYVPNIKQSSCFFVYKLNLKKKFSERLGS